MGKDLYAVIEFLTYGNNELVVELQDAFLNKTYQDVFEKAINKQYIDPKEQNLAGYLKDCLKKTQANPNQPMQITVMTNDTPPQPIDNISLYDKLNSQSLDKIIHEEEVSGTDGSIKKCRSVYMSVVGPTDSGYNL